jgi:hypothetical protein
MPRERPIPGVIKEKFMGQQQNDASKQSEKQQGQKSGTAGSMDKSKRPMSPEKDTVVRKGSTRDQKTSDRT